MMKPQVITLVGCGPRGVTLLDRLLAILKNSDDRFDLTINIVNLGELGCGVHERSQPESLLVSTVASQITLFTDETVIGAGPLSTGPCFFTWAQTMGYKYDEANRRYTKTMVEH